MTTTVTAPTPAPTPPQDATAHRVAGDVSGTIPVDPLGAVYFDWEASGLA